MFQHGYVQYFSKVCLKLILFVFWWFTTILSCRAIRIRPQDTVISFSSKYGGPCKEEKRPHGTETIVYKRR